VLDPEPERLDRVIDLPRAVADLVEAMVGVQVAQADRVDVT